MSAPQLISGPQLVALTGINDGALRRHAANGLFPKPKNGQYEFLASIRGLFRLYAEERSKADSVRELPHYDSMQQCAAATGIPIETLKKAKRGGCMAFEHGRVKLSEFLQWMFSQGDSAEIDWGVEFKKWRAKGEQLKVEKRKSELVGRDVVLRFHSHIISGLDQLIEQMFVNELPSVVAGLDVPQARIILRRSGDRLRELVGGLGKWEE